ncbi:hypothetical protein MSHOH_2617 [Methanosarcina horonobensis HB-1 = JCM 15518]|uniref:Uncharacterized protein n=1 Tax=Methanosarcina horonobensis HB-1 = JCM 15518 TaxID=1434110 RepID=A0A0E3WW57_9EURY|nr:hypothetical protein [Methanosarcina horonobensis]AKB79100.1 hypothetical protein MSHOH_2617 [Methanosarcina horonobensis HB-1 = JCM 15518]
MSETEMKTEATTETKSEENKSFLPKKIRIKTSKFRRGKIAWALKLLPGSSELELVKMRLIDGRLRNWLENEDYALGSPAMKLNDGKNLHDLYILDAAKGCTVTTHIVRDPDKYMLDRGDGTEIHLGTNPYLVQQITDATVLQNAFKIKPDEKEKLKSMISGLAIGVLIGLMF